MLLGGVPYITLHIRSVPEPPGSGSLTAQVVAAAAAVWVVFTDCCLG
jgi:hypothetical protein